MSGSSPLARGLPGLPEEVDPRFRIIPARAGFTVPLASHVLVPWDHPRSRGVYVNGVEYGVVGGGSSPLARGLLGEKVSALQAERIIPARAGFTLC